MWSTRAEERKGTGASILAIWIIVTGFIELGQGRITPSGGFATLDYLLIILMPVGSLVSGRYWRYKPVHFIYGCFGSLIFLHGYMSSGRFALSLWSPVDRNLWAITLGWCAFSFVMGIICRWAPSYWSLSRRLRRLCTICGHTLSGSDSTCPECGGHGEVCDACGYNLTGNESGICPECGRPTPKGGQVTAG